MPAKSKAQQRLMAQAYGVKKGEISLDDVDSDYRDEIEKLADQMSLEDLKDFAETSHEDLPDKVKEAFKKSIFAKVINIKAGDITIENMGPIELPSASANAGAEGGDLGSGDGFHSVRAESWYEYINGVRTDKENDDGEEDDDNEEETREAKVVSANKMDKTKKSGMKYLKRENHTVESFDALHEGGFDGMLPDNIKKAKDIVIEARDNAFEIANNLTEGSKAEKLLSKNLPKFQSLVNTFEKFPTDRSGGRFKKPVDNAINQIDKENIIPKLHDIADALGEREKKKYERKIKNLITDISNAKNLLEKALKDI
jgi:hypothetical protein